MQSLGVILKILLVGDVFGKPGRRAVFEVVPRLLAEEPLDLVIVNGENAAGGKGLTAAICSQFFDMGVDVITSGNHVRDKKEIDETLRTEKRLLRPLNYPDSMPGHGSIVLEAKNGREVAVLNAIGRVHLGEITSPFVPLKKAVEEARQRTPIVIVDFHAEATSEKRAMGWWLDGLASAVLGTHTHVQTADNEILPEGTGYMSDVGMSGAHDSVIGLRKDLALERFLQNKRGKFDVGKHDVKLCGAIVTIDDNSGRALEVKRVRETLA